MNRLNQQGATSLLVPFILVLLLFIGAAGFGLWAFQGRQDYKNNVDVKIAVAEKKAQETQSQLDQDKYNNLEKQPYVTYTGPEQYGSIKVVYPKTWSSYVDTSGTSGSGVVVDGYFYPGTVPSTTASDSVFALRLEVQSQSYSQVLASLSNQQTPPKVSPFSLKLVPSVIGARVTGAILNNKTGDMILLPLRDKTLVVWTEGTKFENDFNNIILPNLSFSP